MCIEDYHYRGEFYLSKLGSLDQQIRCLILIKIPFDNNIIKKDDMFVMTAGVPVGVTGTTNMIKIERVE